MSLETTLARISQLQTAFSPPVTAGTATATATAPASTSPAGGTFATQLQGAMATNAASPVAGATGAGAGSIVPIAEAEVGQAEQPPGSNDGPRLATYRTATVGAAAGEPWCAYFASWVAKQAGVPLGDHGQGFGSCSDIWSWAQSTGRAIPNGAGVTPHPGDLILFGGEHVGIVDKVLPGGSIQTIEGNYSDKVSQVVRGAGEASGYVRLG
ncbi:MAG: CHAP domain-containing protein [Solirubrobacteraceae bacterium]